MKIRSFLRRYFTSYMNSESGKLGLLSLFFSPRYIATNPINSSVYKKRNHGYNRTVESGTKGKRKKERRASMNFLFVDRSVSHANSSGWEKDRNKAERGGKDKGIAY